MDQVKIGAFISQLRKEHNMTQKALGDMLGVSDRAVSKWENGRGLPDVSFMKQLCRIFDITVDELLSGERCNKAEAVMLNESNLLNALLSWELEIRKRRMISKLCSVLFAIVIVIGSFAAFRFFGLVISTVRGEGYSLSTAVSTVKAERAAELIENGKYGKAARYIGFLGLDSESAKKLWIENMEALDGVIDIERFELSRIILNDRFPVGAYFITVYDRESGARYVFDGQITVQDGGVAFGCVYISGESTDNRRTQVAELIDKALCTWNPG